VVFSLSLFLSLSLFWEENFFKAHFSKAHRDAAVKKEWREHVETQHAAGQALALQEQKDLALVRDRELYESADAHSMEMMLRDREAAACAMQHAEALDLEDQRKAWMEGVASRMEAEVGSPPPPVLNLTVC
jgi:hypothetical protein